MIGNSRHALAQKSIVSYAFPSNLPAGDIRLSRSVWNLQIEQKTSVLTIFCFPQTDPILKIKIPLKKNSGQKITEKSQEIYAVQVIKMFLCVSG